jgi:signal transduction histidine kinase
MLGATNSPAAKSPPVVRAIFRAGHDRQWAQETWDDAEWRPIRLDRSWHAQSVGMPWRVGDEGWYRLTVVMPADVGTRPWTASAGFVGNVSELWLNGLRLGGIGSFELPEVTAQRAVHAAVVPPQLLHPGTNLIAVRVRNVGGAGGILGGPVGVFETGTFLPAWKHLELQREVTRVGLAALCFGWALVPLLFRLVGDRTGMFSGAGVPAALIGTGVLLHSQWVNSVALGPARPVLALLAWLVAGSTAPAIYGFAKRLGRPSRTWDLWVAVGTLAFFACSFVAAKDLGRVMEIYAAFAVWMLVPIAAQCRSAPAERQLVARATLAGTVALTISGLLVAALGVWPLVPFAAQWWDFSDVGTLVFVTLLGGALLRGHVLARRQEVELGRRLVVAHGEERSRLGRQLHDGALQDIQYWRLQAEIGNGENPAQPPRELLGAIGSGLRDVARELRQVAEDLQPVAARRQDLAGALTELGERLGQRHGVACRTSAQLRDDVPGAVRETLYRMAQEALGNACRHSGAAEVEVEVHDDGRLIQLEVRDAGRGFEPKDVAAGRLGLGFLRDHAEWIGGCLAVRSSPGRGTTVSVTLRRPFRGA